jgi:sulfofructose kinase
MSRENPLVQVFGLGQCCLDYIAKVKAYPPADVKCEFNEMVIQGGGPVATALVALARWGLSCGLAGVLGDDLFGSMIKASLDEEGIDTSGIVIRPGSESQFAFIVAEPGIGRRTIFWRRPTGRPPGSEEINYRMLEQAKVLHTDGNFGEVTLAACAVARKAGVQIVVDADSFYEGMIDLARLSNHFIASENFAAAFLGKDNPMEACRKIAKLGPQVVGVTLGPRGYVALTKGKVVEKPAYPVEAVDTTGCGDVFHAGFIYGLIQGWDFEKCFDFAAWSAAMVSLQMGGRSGIPSLLQVKEKGYG